MYDYTQWKTKIFNGPVQVCYALRGRRGQTERKRSEYFLSRPHQKGEADPLGPPWFSFCPFWRGRRGEDRVGLGSCHWFTGPGGFFFFFLVFSSFCGKGGSGVEASHLRQEVRAMLG